MQRSPKSMGAVIRLPYLALLHRPFLLKKLGVGDLPPVFIASGAKARLPQRQRTRRGVERGIAAAARDAAIAQSPIDANRSALRHHSRSLRVP